MFSFKNHKCKSICFTYLQRHVVRAWKAPDKVMIFKYFHSWATFIP